jgi:N-acetyl-gamma-glutamyl-phosphate reductase
MTSRLSWFEVLDEGYRVLDMSGAYRLRICALSRMVRLVHVACTARGSAYGLPNSLQRRSALRAGNNPGCYATATILPLLPLFRAGVIDRKSTVIVDGKSGVSGRRP